MALRLACAATYVQSHPRTFLKTVQPPAPYQAIPGRKSGPESSSTRISTSGSESRNTRP